MLSLSLDLLWVGVSTILKSLHFSPKISSAVFSHTEVPNYGEFFLFSSRDEINTPQNSFDPTIRPLCSSTHNISPPPHRSTAQSVRATDTGVRVQLRLSQHAHSSRETCGVMLSNVDHNKMQGHSSDRSSSYSSLSTTFTGVKRSTKILDVKRLGVKSVIVKACEEFETMNICLFYCRQH